MATKVVHLNNTICIPSTGTKHMLQACCLCPFCLVFINLCHKFFSLCYNKSPRSRRVLPKKRAIQPFPYVAISEGTTSKVSLVQVPHSRYQVADVYIFVAE